MSKTTIHSFVPLQRLGEGTFSSVYKVKRISDNCIYALKKIKISSLKEKEKLNALNEIRILASLDSPYIATYKQAFFDQQLKLLCIVMELANDGDLFNKIAANKTNKSPLNQGQIWKIIYHLTKGLDVLHQNKVLHRDMKCANIFINDGIYKIGDLNVSKVLSDQKLVKTQTGTPYYASPEVWRDQPYGEKSDIWSFGCIIYEVCTFRPPFLGDSLDQLFKNIQKGRFPPIASQYSHELHQFIQKCLNLKPENRPSTQQLLQPRGTILSKCQFYQIMTEKQQNQPNQPMLSTIKMPFDIKQLNHNLPNSKYDSSIDINRPKSLPRQNKSHNLKESISKRQGTISSQIQGKQKNQSVKNVNTPLPQRIKHHLQNISHTPYERMPNRRSKQRVQTSIGSRQRPLLRNIDKIPLLGSAIYSKKPRPQSCQIRSRPMRPLSGLPQVTKPKNQKSVQIRPIKSQQPSILQNKRYYRPEPSYIRHHQPTKPDNNRCQSAEYRRPISSSYFQLKKRFQTRQKQLHSSALYPENRIKPMDDITKSEANILERHIPFLSKQVYIKNPLSKRLEKPHQDRQYLEQIQNKILGSGNTKTKKCVPITSTMNLQAQRIKGTFNKYNQNVRY